MADRYAINGATLSGIAGAVRNLRHEKDLLTPAQIQAKIAASRLGIPISVTTHVNPDTGEWERPAGWPDLDSIDLSGFDGWYMTYDLSKIAGYGWAGITAKNENGSTPFYVERGHLERGVFVTDESHAVNSGAYFRQSLDEGDGLIQLWRVRSEGHLQRCHFASNTGTNAQNYAISLQPCVERVGRMPYVTDLRSEGITAANANNWRYTTYWLERDAVRCGGSGRCTRMDGTWQGAYSLQSLDVSGWDTTNWAVTDTRSCFASCQSLKALTVPESLGVVQTQASNVAEHRPNTPCIETFSGVKIYVNHTYAAALMLARQSLIAIINRLPTVTAARTITLGQTNKLKLTAEEIAIATQKGWTVA